MLRINPALLRNLEDYVRKQSGPRGPYPQPQEALSAGASTPVPASLLTIGLQQLLMLFSEDEEACFSGIQYDELSSYFTLTRGTITETPGELSQQRTVSAGLITNFGGIIPAGHSAWAPRKRTLRACAHSPTKRSG